MTLNLNISNIATNASAALENVNDAQTAKGGVAPGASYNALSVTRGTASREDIAAAEIGESSLTRTDALGKLIKAAYNFPPPPPPWE